MTSSLISNDDTVPPQPRPPVAQKRAPPQPRPLRSISPISRPLSNYFCVHNREPRGSVEPYPIRSIAECVEGGEQLGSARTGTSCGPILGSLDLAIAVPHTSCGADPVQQQGGRSSGGMGLSAGGAV